MRHPPGVLALQPALAALLHRLFRLSLTALCSPPAAASPPNTLQPPSHGCRCLGARLEPLPRPRSHENTPQHLWLCRWLFRGSCRLVCPLHGLSLASAALAPPDHPQSPLLATPSGALLRLPGRRPYAGLPSVSASLSACPALGNALGSALAPAALLPGCPARIQASRLGLSTSARLSLWPHHIGTQQLGQHQARIRPARRFSRPAQGPRSHPMPRGLPGAPAARPGRADRLGKVQHSVSTRAQSTTLSEYGSAHPAPIRHFTHRMAHLLAAPAAHDHRLFTPGDAIVLRATSACHSMGLAPTRPFVISPTAWPTVPASVSMGPISRSGLQGAFQVHQLPPATGANTPVLPANHHQRIDTHMRARPAPIRHFTHHHRETGSCCWLFLPVSPRCTAIFFIAPKGFQVGLSPKNCQFAQVRNLPPAGGSRCLGRSMQFLGLADPFVDHQSAPGAHQAPLSLIRAPLRPLSITKAPNVHVYRLQLVPGYLGRAGHLQGRFSPPGDAAVFIAPNAHPACHRTPCIEGDEKFSK